MRAYAMCILHTQSSKLKDFGYTPIEFWCPCYNCKNKEFVLSLELWGKNVHRFTQPSHLKQVYLFTGF